MSELDAAIVLDLWSALDLGGDGWLEGWAQEQGDEVYLVVGD